MGILWAPYVTNKTHDNPMGNICKSSGILCALFFFANLWHCTARGISQKRVALLYVALDKGDTICKPQEEMEGQTKAAHVFITLWACVLAN